MITPIFDLRSVHTGFKPILVTIGTVITSLVMAKNPPSLPVTNPKELNMMFGYESGTIVDDIWFVPYTNYRLTKIEMWKNIWHSSGFMVTFSPPKAYDGWPEYTHMFGFDSLTDEYADLTFTEDITSIGVCGLRKNELPSHDLEGFEFMEAGSSSYKQIVP